MVKLKFVAGTLEVRGWPNDLPAAVSDIGFVLDARTGCLRAPASAYHDLLRFLVREDTAYDDQARGYQTLAQGALVHRGPRPYQTEALAAWRAGGGRGVVVLPTG